MSEQASINDELQETDSKSLVEAKALRREQFTRPWMMWLTLNIVIALYFLYALVAPASSIKSAWLPGETTHGHYQIELSCNECHNPEVKDGKYSAEDVMQQSCIRCHGEQLKNVKDTHPAKKFNDPTNADRLQILDAQNCLTCHQEHVPERTLTMAVTVPQDYCWHCHQDVADSRASHQGMAFDSCATAGCHNYHDNRALYEKFLNDHYGEPDHLSIQRLPARNFASRWMEKNPDSRSLQAKDADGPKESHDETIVQDWLETAHAKAGINCSGCHQVAADSKQDQQAAWSDKVSMDACGKCHEGQVDTFLTGKHGMRLAAGMSPMTPGQARLPMHTDAAHRELSCNTCHPGHRFDTAFAATDACLQCHADDHSLAYLDSSHASLWRDELEGSGEVGTGVSCATCHMPRLVDGDEVFVTHDQNANLRPNESMARQVCNSCHGLEFSLSSLASEDQVRTCFSVAPEERTKSVQMAHDWFESRAKKRNARSRPKKSK